MLQPGWLTKASSTFSKTHTRILRRARPSRLTEIWDTEALGGYEPRDHPYFLRLMEKFEVSYRIPETQQSLVGQLCHTSAGWSSGAATIAHAH